jgi:hypothetical protein
MFDCLVVPSQQDWLLDQLLSRVKSHLLICDIRVVLIKCGVLQIRTSIQVFYVHVSKKRVGTWKVQTNKKSTIARHSICRAALCPSRPFQWFGAIRVIFCVDSVLFRNKYPIVTACCVICIIFCVDKSQTLSSQQNG